MRVQVCKASGVALLVASLVVVFWGAGPPAGAADRSLKSGIAKSGFDAKVRPQDDLFRHVNGGWIAEAKIPAEYGSFGTFMELRDNALADLRAIIEEAARQGDQSAGSEARKIGDLYTGFMDEKRSRSWASSRSRLTSPGSTHCQDKAALVRTLAEFQRQGIGGTFRLFVSPDAKQSDREIVYLSQGGISLPDESFYRDPKFQPIREAFVAHVERMFALAGRPEPAVAAKQVMELETRLAKHHWDRVKSRDQTLTYNKKDRARARRPDSRIRLVDATSTPRGPRVYRRSSSVSRTTSPRWPRRSSEVPLDQWKTWLAWQVHRFGGILPEQGDGGRGLRLRAEAHRRHRAAPALEAGRHGSSRAALGEAAGKLYVARHFPPEAKARMQQLVENLIEAYRQDIQDLDWMSPETKKKALEKLAKFTPKIGYPDKWRDYSKLEIRRDDLVGNVRRASAFEHDRDLAKLGKPVDRTRMGHDPADGQRLLQPAASTRSSSRPRSSSRRSSTGMPTMP